MKKINRFLVILLLLFSASATAFSEETLIDRYGVKLTDYSYDGGSYNLYNVLNNYLSLEGSNAYSSSIDLFNERGINPATVWTTSGSSLLKAFNMSAFWHQLNVLTPEGEDICKLYDAGEFYEDGKVYNLPDGVSLDFQLLPFWANDYDSQLWAWYSDISKSSNPFPEYDGRILGPGDGEIHMLAFDITDLYNAKNGTEFESVYMFGWEDLPGYGYGNSMPDFDYNDVVIIMTNLAPESATPEPATMLILLVGGGLVSARCLRRKEKNL
ncbi:MAG: PEP-CTERM sorting domain-containing protein [Planctomycetaceae bacterium]|jgi:hypothetical protein|nr:PEP-CTERM sorting domain-containing protein [Planctomycetaceae bacterium]